jgi:hypothetical protein
MFVTRLNSVFIFTPDFNAIWFLLKHLQTCYSLNYGGADKSLARPGRKHATATEDFEFHISYL